MMKIKENKDTQKKVFNPTIMIPGEKYRVLEKKKKAYDENIEVIDSQNKYIEYLETKVAELEQDLRNEKEKMDDSLSCASQIMRNGIGRKN